MSGRAAARARPGAVAGAPSSSPPYRYAERAPSPAIAPWILSLWSFQSDATPPADDPYTVWPDGCLSLALAREAHAALLVCVGPRLTALRPPVAAGRRLWGARLWPDAVSAVTALPARALRDHLGPAPAPIAGWAAALDAAVPRTDDVDEGLRAVDAFLTVRLAGAAPPDPQVRRAVAAIVAARGEVAMADVAREAGLGLRQLQRRFPQATGLTLREYARVRRLRAALAHRIAERPSGWSRIAAETGFVDQAHLTREVVSLTGVRPTEIGRQLDRTRHDDVVP